MPSFTGGNLGLTWGFVAHEDGWGNSYDNNFKMLDAIVHLSVIQILSTPPGTPAAEDRYLVGPTATGAWTGQEDKIAVWTKVEDPDTRDWVFLTPKPGWRLFNADDELWYRYDGADWIVDTDPSFGITAPDEGDILRHDGTKFVNVRPMRGISFGSDPDPSSVHTADQMVFLHRFSFAFTILANFADYLGSSTTFGATANATADTVFRVQKAVAATPLTFVDVGTLTIGAGGVDLTDKDSSDVDIDFAKDDIVMILAPTSPDATLAGTFGNLIGLEA